MHEPPLVEAIVRELHLAPVDRVEDVLRPRHEQPDDRAALLAHGADDPFGLDAHQQHRPAARQERPEPVHLRARVVERRDAEEAVVARLPVMRLLDLAGMEQALVLKDDGFREARRAAREVDRRIVFGGDRDVGAARAAVADEPTVRLGKARAVVADVEARLEARHAVDDLLDASRERRPEHERVRIGQFETVPDLLRRVAEVERHGHAPRAEDAEVDRQPVEAVHQEDRDLLALLEAAREEEVRKAVRLLVELLPRDLAAERRDRRSLDQRILAPRRVVVLQLLRIDLDKRDVVRPVPGVARKNLCNVIEFHSSLKIPPPST